jgi:hypothetical protein
MHVRLHSKRFQSHLQSSSSNRGCWNAVKVMLQQQGLSKLMQRSMCVLRAGVEVQVSLLTAVVVAAALVETQRMKMLVRLQQLLRRLCQEQQQQQSVLMLLGVMMMVRKLQKQQQQQMWQGSVV